MASTKSFFHVSTTKKTGEDAGIVQRVDTSRLTSIDPTVAAFYAQLNPKERIAHTIAIDKLGTSYDVTRTHAFLKWSRGTKVPL